jgi:isoaspartyl peptidase/L-asparaginase-like protein (Ntn-hydrolase superfamily)
VAVDELKRRAPQAAAKSTIRHLFESTGGEAGVILVDAAGQIGAAHNAAAMEVATFDTIGGSHHLFVPSYQG